MSQLKYYFDLMSQPCRAVYILLKLNKVPFESCPVALRKGEHFTDEYKKINPFSLVPSIDDNGFYLTESIAISKYVIGKYNLPEHWFPRTDLTKQAKVEEYLQWQHFNTRWGGSNLMQQKLIIPVMKTRKLPDEKHIEGLRKKMKITISSLETYFIRGEKYLAGNEISLADLFGSCELMQLYGCEEQDLIENSPVVKAWLDRVKSETNPYFDEAHKIIYRTKDAYKEVISKL